MVRARAKVSHSPAAQTDLQGIAIGRTISARGTSASRGRCPPLLRGAEPGLRVPYAEETRLKKVMKVIGANEPEGQKRSGEAPACSREGLRREKPMTQRHRRRAGRHVHLKQVKEEKRGMGKKAVLAVIVSLVAAAPASAAVRSGSETFNLNSSDLTFNPQPQLPLLTIAVSYDDAGTVTLTESGGNVQRDIDDQESFGGIPWSGFQWEFSDVNFSSSNATDVDIDSFGALGDNQVAGGLQPQVTPSSDGTSVTAVWSNPYLASLNLIYVRIGGSTVTCNSDEGCSYDGGAFYFPGYDPIVTIHTPGTQAAQVGFAASSLQLAAQMTGVARSDPKSGITSLTATGLPPGLTMNGVGLISGTPTQPGNYTTTVTATGLYNDGTQNATATTMFGWDITRPAAKLPVALGVGQRGQGLRASPGVLTVSGDGAAFFAGLGRASHRPRVGRLHWSKWTPTDGVATGAYWMDNCRPDCASGLRTPYRVKLHAYRPEVVHGYNMFMQLAVAYTRKLPPYTKRRAYIMSLAYDRGFFWK